MALIADSARSSVLRVWPADMAPVEFPARGLPAPTAPADTEQQLKGDDPCQHPPSTDLPLPRCYTAQQSLAAHVQIARHHQHVTLRTGSGDSQSKCGASYRSPRTKHKNCTCTCAQGPARTGAGCAEPCSGSSSRSDCSCSSSSWIVCMCYCSGARSH